MPLLEAEPRAYPETLFCDPEAAAAPGAKWWVLYTRARMEKSLARQLRAHSIPFYLPIYRQTWKANGRVRSSYLPLFPGYVFLLGDENARLTALSTNLLCTTFPVPDQKQLFDDLARVERLLGGPVPVIPETELPVGATVEIVDGPFHGLRGKVLSRGQQTRLVVEVEFLKRGVSIEVESWSLRPLSVSA